MNRILLLTAVVGATILLAGCASPSMSTQDALNESTAIEDVSNDDTTISLTLQEQVKQNDEDCVTTYNPALGTSTTTCYDDWQDVAITEIRVENGSGTHIDTIRGDNLNGQTVETQLPIGDGEYYFHLTSAEGGTTVFSIEVTDDGRLTIVGAGYSNTY